MRLQQQENQIRIEVRNAQFTLQQNRARVEAARAGVELGRQSLDAESKKYSLGASTNTLVLQAQRDLAQSESTLVTALGSYEKSRVELDRAIGATLDRTGIDIADATIGTVRRLPNVPYVTPRPPDQPNPQMDQPKAQPDQASRIRQRPNQAQPIRRNRCRLNRTKSRRSPFSRRNNRACSAGCLRRVLRASKSWTPFLFVPPGLRAVRERPQERGRPACDSR